MLFLIAIAFLTPSFTNAEPIPVKQMQGSTRGFLIMRSETGKILAHGELIQVGAAHASPRR